MKKLFSSVLLALLAACSHNGPEPDPNCIDPARISSSGACAANIDPVCGCNGKTYGNTCEADRAGVRSVTKGPCP